MSRFATALAVIFLTTSLAGQAAPPAKPGTSTAPEPEGFSTLKWGATSADIKAAFPAAKCKQQRPEKDGSFVGACEVPDFRIGDIRTSATLRLRNDAFWYVLVRFSSYEYDKVKALLFEKYGPDASVSTSSRKESALSAAMTSRNGKAEIYEETHSIWSWPDTQVDFMDNRKNGPYSAYSNFEIKRISPDEKAARAKALNSF